jgi:hypothetical protein
LRFYHRSFSEFLESEFRAQHLFVSETPVRKYVTESCLQNLLEPEKFWNSCESLLHIHFDQITETRVLFSCSERL